MRDSKKKIEFFTLMIGVCLFLVLAAGCKKSTTADDGVVYFMISEMTRLRGDSFILPLSDPADIAAADKIVNDINSTTACIVSARIAKGGGDGRYLNKDLLDGTQRVWSWHVTEFFGFVDVTAEIYDSWPGYVENHLDEWLQQNSGVIGFWNYTVTRRVDALELQ